ncbi:MAG: hypothetical protein ABIK43_02260 [candidate division WOR-3 bacterium]
MDFFQKLDSAEGLKLLCGMVITVGPRSAGGQQQFSVRTVQGRRGAKAAEYGLLALHYYGHILARYPRAESVGYERSGSLQAWIGRIIEEGIWPGSDLVSYAGLSEEMCVVPATEGREILVALIRPLFGEDLDAVVEIPAGIEERTLMLSVVALLQGLIPVLDDDSVQLLDNALRYLRSYHDEGADWSAAGAARSLANRAFRQAGGSAA